MDWILDIHIYPQHLVQEIRRKSVSILHTWSKAKQRIKEVQNVVLSRFQAIPQG